MLLQDFFASARLHTEHNIFFLSKSAANYLHHLKSNNIIGLRKTANTETLTHDWLRLT